MPDKAGRRYQTRRDPVSSSWKCYNEITQFNKVNHKKSRECTAKNFTGHDAERLQEAIQKEVNSNDLATGAYKLLSREEYIRATKPDLIMKSRYVITKRSVEEHAVEDAPSADELLDQPDEQGPGPRQGQVSARHAGLWRGIIILDLETT